MVALSAISVGDVLYATFRERMGNTTLRRTVVRRKVVNSIHADFEESFRRGAYLDDFNGRKWYSEQNLKALRRTPPKEM